MSLAKNKGRRSKNHELHKLPRLSYNSSILGRDEVSYGSSTKETSRIKQGDSYYNASSQCEEVIISEAAPGAITYRRTSRSRSKRVQNQLYFQSINVSPFGCTSSLATAIGNDKDILLKRRSFPIKNAIPRSSMNLDETS